MSSSRRVLYRGEVETFKSEADFTEFLDQFHRKKNYLIGNIGCFQTEYMERIRLDSSTVAGDFSGTNTQVKSINEADLLKTDGTYMYTIRTASF